MTDNTNLFLSSKAPVFKPALSSDKPQEMFVLEGSFFRPEFLGFFILFCFCFVFDVFSLFFILAFILHYFSFVLLPCDDFLLQAFRTCT